MDRSLLTGLGFWFPCLRVLAHLIMKTLLGAILTLSFYSITAAAERVALVIGVNNYSAYPQHKQLTSARNDAEDMTAVLRKIGFDVQEPVLDGGRQAIMDAKRRFLQGAKGAQIALFYFSGHGLQVGDENYLMPADMPPITSFTVMRENAIQLRDSVMAGLEEAGAGTKIIILDCCRDNPFASQIAEALGTKSFRTKGGSGEITGYGPGFFLAFASSPGATALDGNGERNSPFTAALLTHLKDKAGSNIRDLFDEVKSDMQTRRGTDQVPWVNDSLNKDHVKVMARQTAAAPILSVSMPSTAKPPTTSSEAASGFTNSLGMKFASVSETSVMFCIHETRNVDYAAYANNNSNVDGEWKKEFRKGTELYPVVLVNYSDAKGFCQWLSSKERKTYRLPTDSEWSQACGMTKYPWGDDWPPSLKDGNYEVIDDGYSKTAPVMTFNPNKFGIYDLGGNVWEWCINSRESGLRSSGWAILRGGSWRSSERLALTSSSSVEGSWEHLGFYGFRIVLVPEKSN